MKGCYSFMKKDGHLYKYVAGMGIFVLIDMIKRVILTLQPLEFPSCLGHLGSHLPIFVSATCKKGDDFVS